MILVLPEYIGGKCDVINYFGTIHKKTTVVTAELQKANDKVELSN